jgi:cytochrome P450
MTVSATSALRYDPYDITINADPYPVFARLREEAPLYYNDEYDFYALSRFDDVSRALVDHETFSSARGAILEIIKADIDIPSGILIFEDPPLHDIHRNLLARLFTPRRIGALEPQIRDFCARILDPRVEAGELDFVTDLGAILPMRVVGMLLGIPEGEQSALFEQGLANLDTEPGQPITSLSTGEFFSDYVDWRAAHPSDDLMTELLTVEFEDETGVRRRLARDELQLYLTVVSSAGADTTTRLLGWMGEVLAKHPEQCRQIAEDRSLVASAIEELVRFEPPAMHVARYVTRDVEIHGQTIPAGNVVILLIGAANRDSRQFSPDGDTFDIHRSSRQHLGFGVGTHYCLGNALARLEGRIALDEILTRFPAWEVDRTRAKFVTTSLARGWASMPARVIR